MIDPQNDPAENELVKRILEGDKKALSSLIVHQQPFIYNLSWKMIGDPTEAEDVSQDIMVKIITKLSQFRFESAFRTWAYRIVVNYLIDYNKKSPRFPAKNFDELGGMLDSVENIELDIEQQIQHKEEIAEVRLQCMSGMLLCLNKEQRMIYLIGELFNANHTIGSEIMNISKVNFRVKLSKAKKDLQNFMLEKCGLVNSANPCRCHKKVTVALKNGMVDAKNLLFNRLEYSTFRNEIESAAHDITDDYELKIAELHQELSYRTQFNKKDFLNALLEDTKWKQLLNLN